MKNILKFSFGLAGFVALGTLGSPGAKATDLLNDPADTVTAANPTELGRIGRDTTGANEGYGLQQTWTPSVNGEKAYPGTAGATTSYSYRTYTFTPAQLGNGQFIQIDFNVPSVNTLFVSAWTTFSGTTSAATGAGWLGDAGQSENYQGPTDARFFNVTVPAGQNLVVVVNTTPGAGGGLGVAYGLQVESYSDVEFTDITAVPEPSTWALLGVGTLLGGVAVARRRRTAA